MGEEDQPSNLIKSSIPLPRVAIPRVGEKGEAYKRSSKEAEGVSTVGRNTWNGTRVFQPRNPLTRARSGEPAGPALSGTGSRSRRASCALVRAPPGFPAEAPPALPKVPTTLQRAPPAWGPEGKVGEVHPGWAACRSPSRPSPLPPA